MPATEFKLSKKYGITRRAAFPERPTWKVLSARINELFDIPLDRVAVSYLDSDGDEVTLNTEEELTHFYKTCKLNYTIKLSVQDLASLRLQPSGMPSSQEAFSLSAHLPEPQVEEEWHIPTFDGVFIRDPSFQPSRHASVEESDSDAEEPLGGKGVADTASTPTGKGKSRAVTMEDLDKSFASSAISSDLLTKPPIHVYDFSEAPTPVLAQSTPRAPMSEAGEPEGEEKKKPGERALADDPPLPWIEPKTSTSPPSLSSDIANLISSFGNVVSSHPELSEGFHNIFRNAAGGTYWRAHRAAISKAAEEISQASQTTVRDLQAEADAGQRVWQALETFFHSLSQATGVSRSESDASAAPGQERAEDTTVQEQEPQPAQPVAPDKPMQAEAPKEQPTFTSISDWRSFLGPTYPTLPSVSQPLHNIPPPPPPPLSSFLHGSHATPFRQANYPPPPPIHSFVPPPSASMPPPFPPSFAPRPPPPPPPPPPPADHSFSYMNASLNRSFGTGPPSGMHAPEVIDMKAKVQAAKSMYRAQKARYLQEREQARQRQKERHRHGAEQIGEVTPFEGFQSLVDVDEEPWPQLISHARGPYAQPEINIPGSFQTHPRSGLFHDSVEDFRSRAIKRICKQLADMGFTESQHPWVADKVASLLPNKGSITKDVEDGIVTNLLEELLPLTSPGPFASGSRSN